MTNQEIAWKLLEVSTFLELKGEKKEKVQDFKKGAAVILQLKGNLTKLMVNEAAGNNRISDRVRKVILDYLGEGYSPLLDQLKKAVPQGLIEMLAIPKLEATEIHYIYQQLGVKDLAGLEEAAKNKKIRQLPKMASKTELSILRGLKMLRENINQAPIGLAKALGEELVRDLSQIELVQQVQLAGAVRRGEELISQVELVLATEKPIAVLNIISKHPGVKKIIQKTNREITFISKIQILVQIKIVPIENYGGSLHFLTGSPQYLKAIDGIAQQKGIDLADLDNYNFEDEASLFSALDLPFIQPELREGREIIDLALNNRVPEVVTINDIQGDLHCHSCWSDGIGEIKELAAIAKDFGYNYLAVTDHSQSLKIAGGLSVERLKQQGEEINQLNETLTDFTLLRGVEADILKNGQLDYEDDILAEMDVVIASIHTNFQMDKEKMTDRITTAMKNKYVNILAHPTGRILGGREGYEMNIDEVIDTAVKTGTVLEINSSVDRLDLNHVHAKKAVAAGAKISINTDTHDPKRFGKISNGVTVAQKAHLSKSDIINTYDLDKLKKFFQSQRAKKEAKK